MIDRRRVAAALAAGAFLLLAPLSACGGDDDSAEVADTTEAGGGEPIAGSDDSTTTTADDTAEDDGGEPLAGSDDSTTTTADDTAEDDGGEPIAGSDEAIEADEEAEGDGWDLSPFTYRGQDGQRIAYTCSADGTLGSVWGTEVYTDDSSVCSAAVHAGLITVEDGGRVVIEIAPGEEEYEGSEANGVESSDYASWAGSFTFPAA